MEARKKRAKEAKRRETTERGFRIFGRIPIDRVLMNHQKQKASIRVVESSLAYQGPHVWLFLDGVECEEHCGEHMKPDIHISVQEAEQLRRALDRFIGEARRGLLCEKIIEETPDEE